MGARLENAVAAAMEIRRVTRIAILIAIVAGAAILRFDGLGTPSLWLDEILGYDLTTAALSRSVWSWIAGFDAEHGALYYGTQVLGRIAASPEVEARLLPAIFGTVTVILVWWVACAGGEGNGAGLAAAAILAVSPLHVYYSREGRPYALAMLLAALLLIALVRRLFTLFVVAVGAALFTSAIAAPLIAAAAVAAFLSAIVSREPGERRRAWIGTAAALAALALVPLVYRGAGEATTGVHFPAVDAGLFDSIVRALSVSAVGSGKGGRAAWLILILAAIGAVALIRRDRRRGMIVLAMAVLPIAIALFALWISRHFFAIRYVCTAMPAYAVLVATGIATISQIIRPSPARWIILIAAVAAIAAQTLRPAIDEPHRKLDWRVVAATIHGHAHDGDVVMTAEGWSTVSLGFYLRRLPRKVRHVEVTDPVIAHALLAENGRAWLVTAGHSTDTRVRDWFCQFPVVLSSAQEDLRVHYAPSASDFLVMRSLVNERRAIATSRGDSGFTLHLGAEDEMFLREGWAHPEGTGADAFRWVVDGRARMIAPFVTARDRELRVRLSPLDHKGLPPQAMSVVMNGVPVANLILQSGSHDYTVPLPASRWTSRLNTIEFRFSRAHAPAELDRAQRDPRRLSASFDTITVADEGSGPAEGEPAGVIRLQELRPGGVAVPLDEGTLWRGRRSQFDGTSLDEAAVRRLLARLGFDPEVVWTRVAAGTVSLESLMESLATSSACLDDREFVREIWVTVFERAPNGIEERVLLSLLRKGGSRRSLIERVVRMTEFRQAVFRPVV